MANPSVRGQFIWHELMTSDPKAARGFYTKLVGWKTQSWEKDSSYTMFVGAAGPVAGFMMTPDHLKAMGVPPHWLTYMGTPDVDETARQTEMLGGTVLRQPDDIPGTGRFAVLRDPQGAVFAAYTPATESPERDQQVLGEFSWHELATGDPDGAWDFYSELFGWHKTSAMDMGPGGVYQMFGHGSLVLGGIYRKPDNMPAPPHWLPYALITDSKAAAARLPGLGGAVLNGPMEVPGGDWIVVCRDPQGAAFAVHSKAKAAKAAAPAKKSAGKKKVAKKKAAKKKVARKATAKKRPAKKKAVRKAARRAAPKRGAARKKRARKVARKPRKAAGRSSRKRVARKKK